jgi:hypothetical protein
MTTDTYGDPHGHLIVSPYEVRVLRRLLIEEFTRRDTTELPITMRASERAMALSELRVVEQLSDRVETLFRELCS